MNVATVSYWECITISVSFLLKTVSVSFKLLPTYVLSRKNAAANLNDSTSKRTYFMKVCLDLENVCQYLGYL